MLGAVKRHPWRALVIAIAFLVLFMGISGALRVRIPPPSGPFAVGRAHMSWIDSSRAELHTLVSDDDREVLATFWYPAEPGSGRGAPYISDLSDIDDGLVASGQLSPFSLLGWPIAIGLRYVDDNTFVEAEVSKEDDPFPVVLLSPGNGGNVSFYAAIAEELASHGYFVVGVDHPYQGTAVKLRDGKVAVYDSQTAATEGGFGPLTFEERVADVRLVIDRLKEMSRGGHWLGGAMDLSRIGIMGHSNGGIAAVETCREDRRLDACLNMDGQHAGGPFSYRPEGAAPGQPFMYLTKETQIHPEIHSRFEESPAVAYRVVIPEAAHDQFSDGPLLRSAFIPFASRAEDVMSASRSYVVAFFDEVLKDEGAVEQVSAPIEVRLEVFP